MREDVSTDASLAMPAREPLQRGRLFQRRHIVLRGQPMRSRYFGHAAEQASFGAGTNQQLVATRNDERSPPAQSAAFLRGLARINLLIAAHVRRAVLAEWT